MHTIHLSLILSDIYLLQYNLAISLLLDDKLLHLVDMAGNLLQLVDIAGLL